jgi:hypothetical protein
MTKMVCKIGPKSGLNLGANFQTTFFVLDNIIVLNISIAEKILQMQKERERVTSFLNLC